MPADSPAHVRHIGVHDTKAICATHQERVSSLETAGLFTNKNTRAGLCIQGSEKDLNMGNQVQMTDLAVATRPVETNISIGRGIWQFPVINGLDTTFLWCLSYKYKQ